LQYRFEDAGLGDAPYAEVAEASASRLAKAAADAQSGANHLAGDMVAHWQQHLCSGDLEARVARLRGLPSISSGKS
ncbi:unnamed protein product, partial [Symbiodinium natans]